ncbi:MAG: hypothetical protein P1U35_12425 [Cycloclasticus sp.]|nr:hypothetical protein [Cycloclasticus sp.]
MNDKPSIRTSFGIALVSLFLLVTQNVYAQRYEVPPTASTSSGVPIISDNAMEQCVKLYNNAKWLGENLSATQVNNYDSASVNGYNKKVKQHGQMTARFNRDCAGKQSRSAAEAAKKLNNRR